jgi:hypothetical protein
LVAPSRGRAQDNPTICDGGVLYVDFDYSAGGRLSVGCLSGGATYAYYAMVNAPTCASANVPLEILKIWKATVDEALLSGKQIHVYWYPCSEGNRIAAISLRR